MPYILVVYSFIYYLFIPLLLLRFLLRSRLNPAYRRRIHERFGFFNRHYEPGGVHFHLVSVGETLAALPLVERFLNENPSVPVYVTSTTPTGSTEVQKRLGDRVFNVYLPFDLPDCMNRFYKKLAPQATVLMETELWPNLIRTAKNRGCKVMVMNARLSARSASGYNKLASLTDFMLKRLDSICCQDEASAERFIFLGADKVVTSTTGNLKYDIKPSPEVVDIAEKVREAIGRDRPVWIAGSTHKGEDEILLDAHKNILQKVANAVLVIVPRHPERFDSVADLIGSKGLKYVRKSSGADLPAEASVVLGDTLGELQMLYAASDVAFVGGSLVDVGGHNPIEPILVDKPVISGSIYYNFQAVYKSLEACGGVRFSDSTEGIAKNVIGLFESPEILRDQVERAGKEIARHQGALAKTFERLQNLLS